MWTEVMELVERAQAGDRAAYGELVRRFQGAVYAYALKLVRRPHEAEELAQDVFVHAMIKLPQLRTPRCFGGWLKQIAFRMALNRYGQKRALSGAEPGLLESVACVTADPLDAIARHEAAEAVRTAIARLKPLDREVVDLHYLRGLSLDRIRERLDVPLGTVKRRLHTARRRLETLLGTRAAAVAA